MGFANSYKGHKSTLICPNQKCNYHSRKFNREYDEEKTQCNSSIKCPVHQVDLVNIGSSKASVLELKKRKKLA